MIRYIFIWYCVWISLARLTYHKGKECLGKRREILWVFKVCRTNQICLVIWLVPLMLIIVQLESTELYTIIIYTNECSFWHLYILHSYKFILNILKFEYSCTKLKLDIISINHFIVLLQTSIVSQDICSLFNMLAA